MGMIRSSSPRLAGSRGVTLVETLVAATVLGLAFVGTTSILASGKDLETQEYLGRQAFRIAANALEDPFFSPRRFSALALGTIPRPLDSLKSETGQWIFATVSAVITAGTEQFQDDTRSFTPGQPVAYKKIEVRVAWVFAGNPNTISLSKRIADIP